MPPADVLPTYLRLRETQRALNKQLMKSLSKKAIEESARRLGFLEGGQIIADTADLDLVMDTAIYDYYPTGNRNAVARYARLDEVRGDGKKTVLDAMLHARFTLVELGEVVEGVGMHAHDLVFDDRFLLADLGLSQTGVPGLILATRLLAFESFYMTTGVHLVFDEGLASLAGRSFDRLAGRAADVQPREMSFLARFFLQIGMVDPREARIMLAEMAVAQLPRDDPRRESFARLRAERDVGE